MALRVQELLSRPTGRGKVEQIDYRPTPGQLMTTGRGGLVLRGKQYFDQTGRRSSWAD